MSGPGAGFESGLSGLLAARTGLDTVGHNIANVDTDGYTRQRVEQVSREGVGAGNGFTGAGVAVDAIRRDYDDFLTGQLRGTTARLSELDLYRDLAEGIDNLLGSESGGLGPAVDGFFASVHDLASDPASIPARQVVLGDADSLARRFRTLDGRLADEYQGVNSRLRQVVSEINGYAEGIAELNQQIIVAEGAAGGEANDLRDQRDEMIRSLAERVGLDVLEQDDGALNVTIGSGQALVVGSQASRLEVSAGSYDPSRLEVSLSNAAGLSSGPISDLLSGGSLAALFSYRREVLDGARNALGRVALALSHTVNLQHRLGIDLNGNRGTDLFTDLDASAARVLAHQANGAEATLAVRVVDVAALTTSDYRLERQGASYLVTRLSDRTQTTLSGFPGAPALVDGLEISLSAGSMADGDRYLIRPTAGASALMGVEVDTSSEIAAAAPVRAEVALANAGTVEARNLRVNTPEQRIELTFSSPPTGFDVRDASSGATLAAGISFSTTTTYQFNGVSFTLAGAPAAGDTFAIERGVASPGGANAGSGAASVTALAAGDPNLTDPVTLTFDDPPSTFSVSGASTGSPVSGIPFTTGQSISLNGWTLEIVGVPEPGDTITVGPNTAGVGDNRNALALADLQTINLLDGASTTFEGAFGQEIGRVGVLASEAGINAEAEQALHDQVVGSRETVSGVNLDEEAANLLRYQRAYQASAQVLSTADQVFETLLQVMSR